MKEYRAKTGKAIYFVDDDRMMQRLYSRALDLAGHDVYIFNDGEELINYLLETDHAPNVVVTDFNMPKKNGRDVAEFIRQHYGDRVYVVGLTAEEKNIPLFYEAGAHIAMLKSMSDDLSKQLDDLIRAA